MLDISQKLQKILTVDSNIVSKLLHEQICKLKKNNPILLHTDIFKLGLIDGESDETKLSEKWLNSLLTVSGNRPIIIPTFNYDFTNTGIYDVNKSLGQVGLLSKYCCIHHSDKRTLTPVFNCCVFNEKIDKAPSYNAFGEASIFNYLLQRDGSLFFLGTDMRSNTFVHYLEEVINVSYRYLKMFRGVVINGSQRNKIDFMYRVSPKVKNAIVYDYEKVALDLNKKGLIKNFQIGLSKGLRIKVRDYFNYVKTRMENDEHYLLTDDSIKNVFKLYEKYGKPLIYEKMELN